MIKILFNILSKNIFAASIAVNMFSTTILLITLTFLGYSELAADVAIIQGATHAMFMAFSANARNLVLGSSTNEILNQQLFFRLYLLLPLSFAAYFLSSSVVGMSSSIIAIFIFRRCSEWVAELQITESEKIDNKKYAHQFFYFQIAALLILIFSFAFDNSNYYLISLFIWAIAPVLHSAPFIVKVYGFKRKDYKLSLRAFLPHIGSSWVIAISVYVFRVLIVLLVGRTIGGILFSAYAIGGMLNSIYTYALGPSQVFKKQGKSGGVNFSIVAFSLLAVIGSVICILSYVTSIGSPNTNFFIKSIGFSMVGGGIMILAQQQRIYMLQVLNSSVFVPDVLSNILLVSMLPITFSIFGVDALPIIFLANALLTYVFYSFSATDSRYYKWVKSSFFRGIQNREIIQSIILSMLFLPVFFQLKGGIFDSPQILIESFDGLTRIPLPLASISCFIGIILLINFQVSRLSVAILFVFFVVMLMTTFLLYTINNSSVVIGKLILLIQFVLPIFALVLGQSYKEPAFVWLRFESIFLCILIIIVPVQIIVTLVEQSNILTPYFYYFTIYQHLQYIPTIFVSGYLLALFALFNDKIFGIIILILAPFMVFYTILSTSLLAFILLLCGLFMAMLTFWIKRRKHMVSLWIAISVIASVYILNLEFKSEPLFSLSNDVVSVVLTSDLLQPAIHENNLSVSFNEYMQVWGWHLNGITENFVSFILGHEQRPDRSIMPSAHNYYLDLFYNFGLFALLPFIYLVLYTFKQYRKCSLNNKMHSKTISLIAIVFFFILIDNSLQVSFRQPYSGMFIFFLWGVLLSRLSSTKLMRNESKKVINDYNS